MPGHDVFLMVVVLLEQAFLWLLRFSPVNIIPSMIHTPSFIYYRCHVILAVDRHAKCHT